jgi:hypothetical protein
MAIIRRPSSGRITEKMVVPLTKLDGFDFDIRCFSLLVNSGIIVKEVSKNAFEAPYFGPSLHNVKSSIGNSR